MIGVILSSKLVESSLKAQFGEILPIELPIQNKSLIFHQIESLKNYCESIYITIPTGYDFKGFNEYPKIELNSSLSLIQVLNHVVNIFDSGQKIFIYYGDSLFLNIGHISSATDYFFVQQPIHQYMWGASNELGYVPAGGIIINVERLKNFLIGSYDFDSLVKKIQNCDDVNFFKDFEWLDFGHTLTYFNSRKRFLEARSFNKLKHTEGYIIKSSEDRLKMWSEFNWLRKCKERMPSNVPYVTGFNISKNEASYSIEYINQPTLSDIFVFGKIPEYFFIKILESIKVTLLKIQKQKFNTPKISNNFLVEKLEARVNDILQIAENLGADLNYMKKIIDENINYFSRKKFEISSIHGDFCFSNILFDFTIFEPILIDPRGYVCDQIGFSMYGPAVYDYYKLAHSYVVGYDYLIAGNQNELFFSKVEMSKRMKVFCSLFGVEKKDLKMGLKNLFLSMLPLHMDSISRQKSFIMIISKIDDL
jgi:hypothetical protein